jgi:hypothetical protein
MKLGEFIAARRLAAKTSRRGEAFAVIVALSSVFPHGSRGEILAELIFPRFFVFQEVGFMLPVFPVAEH